MSDLLTGGTLLTPNPLLGCYSVEEGRFDELFLGGAVRPHYATLIQELQQLNPAELKRQLDSSQRILQEHDVTYNVYGDPKGMDKPWQMDPIPFIISSGEWNYIEQSVVQRATLLNRIIGDCYGPQEFLRSGILPPGLIHGQPGFLRPSCGIKPIRDIYLHVYAADIARSPDGRWWVTSDRTQIPTGMGYALENRLVSSRILPTPFRDSQVRRLANYFHTLQKSLASLAIHNKGNPRVVLLTPGPYNETYFEQAYLARYLGYPLVEGEDLVVQNDVVYFKTLGGLDRVDVILRRVDDDYCDPLELRNESVLGVPGLLQAVRTRNVAVANFLGCGLAESPALLAFLPPLCQQVLGRELMMPSVATWWCGQEAPLQYVRKNLGHMVIKSAHRSRNRKVYFGEEMSLDDQQDLLSRIELEPHAFVAQERVHLSGAPGWNGTQVTAMPVAFRVYLVFDGDSYSVMPGGLTRVAPTIRSPFVSMQYGGSSKDTWVLSDEPVDDFTLLKPPYQSVELRRIGNNLSSRIANHLYWLGRYTERAEDSARLLRSTLIRFSPENVMSETQWLIPLLHALYQQGLIRSFDPQVNLENSQEMIEFQMLGAVYNAQSPVSVQATAYQITRIGTLLRDRLSPDTWRVLNRLDQILLPPDASTTTPLGDAIIVLNRLLLDLATFHGLSMENMTRSPGWRFLDIGHRVERALHLSRILANILYSPDADNPSVLESFLEIADSSITYHSRYTLVPQLAAVCDLLTLDDSNPRALIFQLNQIDKHLKKLPWEKAHTALENGHLLLQSTLAMLRQVNMNEIPTLNAYTRMDGELGRAILRISDALPKIHDALTTSYFTHSAMVRVTETILTNGTVSFCRMEDRPGATPIPPQP